MTIIRIDLDTSKHVFQVHGIDDSEQPVLRRQVRRSEIEKFFAKLPATRIGLEACGASHACITGPGCWAPWGTTHLGQRSPRPHTKAGHMTAIDQTCPSCKKSLRDGGRPHMDSRFRGNDKKRVMLH
jgi:hypothetical protein